MTALTPYHEQLDGLLAQLRSAPVEARQSIREAIDALQEAQLEEQKGKHATWDGMPEYIKDKCANAVLDMIRARRANGQA